VPEKKMHLLSFTIAIRNDVLLMTKSKTALILNHQHAANEKPCHAVLEDVLRNNPIVKYLQWLCW